MEPASTRGCLHWPEGNEMTAPRGILLCGLVLLGPPVSMADAAKPPDSAVPYVAAMTAAFHCSCTRWPSSWNELVSFDDKFHARSQAEGAQPVARVPWATLSKSTMKRSAEGDLIVSIVADVAGATPMTIRVPRPDCAK